MSAFAAMKGSGRPAQGANGSNGVRKFIVHGSADATVHPSNGAMLFQQMASRNPGASVVITDTRSGGRKATRRRLAAGSGEALAEHLLIEGAGHAWSGGNGEGTFADTAGPDVSREMIEFFLRV
jgi:poly(3-hydroxybutyrate) depolymerase